MNLELEEKLSALLDGELTPIEEVELRAELERSPELRQRLAQLEAVDGALRALPGPEATALLKAQLRERLAEAPKASRPPRMPAGRSRRGMGWAASAAVAAALLAFILFSGPRATMREEPPVPEPLARNDDDGTLEEISVPIEKREPGARALRLAEATEEERAVEEFLAPEPVESAEPVEPAEFAGSAEEELDAAALAAASDQDLDVIDVLDLLAALELETTSG